MLVASFIISFVINLSVLSNFINILDAYLKPIVFGLLISLFCQNKKQIKMLFFVGISWIIIQIPIIILQIITSYGDLDAIVGTFGEGGSANLGYLAGLLSCFLIPFSLTKRNYWKPIVASNIVLLLIMLLTGTKLALIFWALTLGVTVIKQKLVGYKFIILAGLLSVIFIFSLKEFAVNYEDLLTTEDMIANYKNSEKVIALNFTYKLFIDNPENILFGIGPGMYTSSVALNSGTYYAKIVNCAYYLIQQKRLNGGTFTNASSSFLALIGENGIIGLLLMQILIWYAYKQLTTLKANRLYSDAAFAMAFFITISLLLRSTLEGGPAINYFYGLNAYLITASQRDVNS